jgi:hypothetical protein
VALVLLGAGVSVLGAEEKVALRPLAKGGETARVRVALKAEGLYRPGPPPGAAAKKAEPAKPLALRVETRLDFVERVVKVDERGRVERAVRRVVQAASAINGEVRPAAAVLRPEVALLVASPRAEEIEVFSPSGPLTRAELELVQGAGDPLALDDLLPEQPVKTGESWPVGGLAARALSAYDALADNGLKATLESVDARGAKLRLAGEVRGSALGGEGRMTLAGSFHFDREAGRVDELTVERSEARQPGPVEAGLEVKSTLTVTRRDAETPAALDDAALAGVPTDPDPARLALLLISPSGKYSLVHDRQWHTYWDDTRQTVLKRLDRGRVVAQCNLSLGPNAGKGRHQDLGQFRDDLRRALGRRFGAFRGEGEVPGDPAGGFRYRVGVQGHEGELPVLWYYYLVASPEGDQLLATFTLAEAQAGPFAEQDLNLIGSLRWKDAAGAGASTPSSSASPTSTPAKP